MNHILNLRATWFWRDPIFLIKILIPKLALKLGVFILSSQIFEIVYLSETDLMRFPNAKKFCVYADSTVTKYTGNCNSET